MLLAERIADLPWNPIMTAEDCKPHPAAAWALCTHLAPIQVDCITAIMLKILDGKCKMDAAEKQAVAAIYHAIQPRPGQLLNPAVHALIARALARLDEHLVEEIYEQRVLAETMISRPVMKGFKALLREAGIIGGGAPTD
jgi:hypothetical protein